MPCCPAAAAAAGLVPVAAAPTSSCCAFEADRIISAAAAAWLPRLGLPTIARLLGMLLPAAPATCAERGLPDIGLSMGACRKGRQVCAVLSS
jgi:hypothetical protein